MGFAGFSFVDAFLNASMILGGMGPVGELQSDGAKWFASFYALFSGIALLGTVAVVPTTDASYAACPAPGRRSIDNFIYHTMGLLDLLKRSSKDPKERFWTGSEKNKGEVGVVLVDQAKGMAAYQRLSAEIQRSNT